jgi:hypothetical protein
MDSETPNNRISRRRMLKRIGAAGAVAWSAPILSSVRTPAFAQYGPPPQPQCAGATCLTFAQCSLTNPDCVCVTTGTGTGTCVPGSTQCAPLSDCGPGNTCPPGFFCAVETCCGRPVCAPVDLAAQCPSAGGRAAAKRVSSGPGTIGG